MHARLLIVLLCLFVLSACNDLAALAPPTISPQAAQGRSLFESYCSRCHETSAEIVVTGPSLAGVASRAGRRISGMDAAAYLRSSIDEPDAYTVEGFPEGIMPLDFKEQLSAEEMDALVAYLLTLE